LKKKKLKRGKPVRRDISLRGGGGGEGRGVGGEIVEDMGGVRDREGVPEGGG